MPLDDINPDLSRGKPAGKEFFERGDDRSLADVFSDEETDQTSDSLADVFSDEETAQTSDSLADVFSDEETAQAPDSLADMFPDEETAQAPDSLADMFPDENNQSEQAEIPKQTVRLRSHVSAPETKITERNEDKKTPHKFDDSRYYVNPSLWPKVEEVLSVISQEGGLQKIANAMVITQDSSVHTNQLQVLTQALRPVLAFRKVNLGRDADITQVIAVVCDELCGVSVLGPLYRDGSIDEILVDRWDVVSVEVGGTLMETRISFKNPEHASSIARVLAQKVSSRAVSNSIPLVSAELPGARLTVAYGSVVKGGLSITIRKFRKLLDLDDLLNVQSLSKDVADFLRDCVQCKAGILVSGGTGTGKTTIINILSNFIPDTERVITIEDAFELKLANKHVVSLQTKEAASMDDAIAVTLADLLRNTLRMRPDRIIVGEIREGLGATVMLDAASTGHEGTMTTIHANDVRSAVNERLPALIRQVRSGDAVSVLRSIAGSFDVVLQVNRGRQGLRYISNVSAIGDVDYTCDMLEVSPIFVGEQDTDGVPEFTRVPVGTDTPLGKRLMQYGKTEWLA